MRLTTLLTVSVLLLTTPLWAADVTVSLKWNANTEPDLDGYNLYRSTFSGQYGAPVATLGKVTQHQLVIQQTASGQVYYFTLTARDLAGQESQKSAEVSTLIPALPPPPPPPIVVTSVPVLTMVTTALDSITMAWPPVESETHIEVRYMPAPISWGQAASATCPASPCTVPGLSPGTRYDFQAVHYKGTLNVDAVFGPLGPVLSGDTLKPSDPPHATPKGLGIVNATADEVQIKAAVADCPRVVTSTKGSTATTHMRTVRCVK